MRRGERARARQSRTRDEDEDEAEWLEEWVVVFFFADGGYGAVAGAEEGVVGKGEDLVADFLFEEVRGLEATGEGASEEGVADDGNVRGVFGPVADDVNDAVFG